MTIYVSNQTDTVRIASEDQNIWGPGAADVMTWGDYVPLIGGDRVNVRDVSARLVAGRGVVEVVGDRVHYDSRGVYDRLRPGSESSVVIETVVVFEDGSRERSRHEITVEGTRAGPTFRYPDGDAYSEGSGINFAAVDAADILEDAHEFGRMPVASGSFDAMSVFGDVIEEVAGGARAAVARAQALVDRAEARADAAENGLETAQDNAQLVTEAFAARSDFLAKRAAATVASAAYAAAQEAAEALAQAQIEEAAQEAAQAVAQAAFDLADAAVEEAEDLVDSLTGQVADAVGALSDLIDWIEDNVPSWLSGAIDALADFLGVGGQLDDARDLVDDLQDDLRDAEDALDDLEADFSDAQEALEAAEEAASQAAEDAIAAAADLADALGGMTMAGLLRARNAAEAQADSAEDAWIEARDAMWDAGVLEGQNPTAAHVASFQAEAALALANHGTAQAGLVGANGVLDAAEATLDAILAHIEGTDVSISAELGVDLQAQVGLQLDMRMDGGSVDTEMSYALETTGTLDTEADTFAIEALATNTTTGDSFAFDTISPNMQFYAGLVYEVSGTFDLLLDMLARVTGDTLIDSSPLSYARDFEFSGWVDLIDLDSADGFGIGIGLPTFVGDIVSGAVAWPTVTTEGTATGHSFDVYTDPGLVDGEDLADLLTSQTNSATVTFSSALLERLEEAGVGPLPEDTAEGLSAEVLGAIQAAFGTLSQEDEPLFVLAISEDDPDALIHLNTIEDVVATMTAANDGSFGFFVGSGASENFAEVTVDIDHLVATIANLAAGNGTSEVFNPLDLSFGLEEVIASTPVPTAIAERITGLFKMDVQVEAFDFDVTLGANLKQRFALSVDDMAFEVTFEDGTEGTFRADEGGSFVFDNASALEDVDGDGEIDYSVKLTPDATFFNDTELGLNVEAVMDFLKGKLGIAAEVSIEDIIGEFDGAIPIPGIDLDFGPLLRVVRELDMGSIDVFESLFDFDAGFGVVEGSFAVPDETSPVPPVGPEPIVGTEGDDRLVGTAEADVIDALGGNDRIDGRGGADVIDAGAGRDRAQGRAGDDSISGAQGRDRLSGQGGDDALNGGNGRDVLIGGRGDDDLTGGSGADTFRFSLNHGSDTITDFTAGTDIIEIRRGAEGLDDLTFEEVGDDVMVSFASVEILVQSVTVAELNQVDNFAF